MTIDEKREAARNPRVGDVWRDARSQRTVERVRKDGIRPLEIEYARDRYVGWRSVTTDHNCWIATWTQWCSKAELVQRGAE